MQLLIWDELEAMERRQEFLLVLDFITGPIADARRRAVRAAAPHRAEAFEAMLVRTSDWYRQAVEKLDRRIALIRTSHRTSRKIRCKASRSSMAGRSGWCGSMPFTASEAGSMFAPSKGLT
jgi:hypothetical protein